jgi:putative hydrolase of the HAD superfamily
MIRAVLFDMGGTLDGDGVHWLDRFAGVYADAGVAVPREILRAAFDAAEERASTDEVMATADLETMVERHVGWQLEHLAMDEWRTRREIAHRFIEPIRTAAALNVKMLARFRSADLTLGVVSNGCGNVDVLCEDLGYAPYLSAIVDSRRVRLFKPDPTIYLYAADRIGMEPSSILMVGDSFERDIRPAKAVGMLTAWLEGPERRDCPAPALADMRLRALAELPAALESRRQPVA